MDWKRLGTIVVYTVVVLAVLALFAVVTVLGATGRP